MLWRIWLARNQTIFNDKKIDSRRLHNKAKGLAMEAVAVSCQRNFDTAGLLVEEWNFIGGSIRATKIFTPGITGKASATFKLLTAVGKLE